MTFNKYSTNRELTHPKLRLARYAVTFFAAVLITAAYPGASFASETLEDRFPGLSNGLLQTAILSDLDSGVILESGSMVVNNDDLDSLLEPYAPQIRSQLERNLFFALEQEVARLMLIEDARAAQEGLQDDDDEELIARLLTDIAGEAEVTDTELQAFYDENQEMVGEASFDQVKEPIRELLLKQKREALIQEHIRRLGQTREIKLDRTWVEQQYVLMMDNPVDQARRSGTPSMIEFGATGCIPCDMMQPVLDSLRAKFGSDLNVVFVHVREQQVLGARYGIRSIPVQVFFDADGNEVFRHEGFFPEEQILPILKDMGLG